MYRFMKHSFMQLWSTKMESYTLRGDNTGNVSAYENGHLKYTITVPDAVKCVFVEKEILYIFTPTELSIYEVTDVGKNVKKFNIPAKPPITLFGEKVNGRYKYAALLAPSGQEIIVLKNSVEDNFETLTINDEFHELTITAIEGADEYLFSADYTGKVVLSQVEGNELKEFVNGSTGSGCCNCLAPMDDKNVFVGCTGGEIMKVAFNSGDKREFKWIRY
ncbi:CLUMA_CG004335, isoform A [Clunio marinus]|uniref:CLUMA_CG004335, isoform A n=1 Tax=Clunio marinus TaxID=568069 RepID=A0A1J1HWX7_9DIPT|nr:CLUMA_CG004335, isoform A [Clunio marinus]